MEWIGTGSGRKCLYMKEYGDTKEMSDTEYLSMKQIADQLNVSKQRVYRCIKSNCISEAHHEVVKVYRTYMISFLMLARGSCMKIVQKVLCILMKLYRKMMSRKAGHMENNRTYVSI